MPPPPFFWSFLIIFIKVRFKSKKLVLNEYEICFKMMEMANLETQIFKNFWGSMLTDPPRKLMPLVLMVLHPPFESPGSVLSSQTT